MPRLTLTVSAVSVLAAAACGSSSVSGAEPSGTSTTEMPSASVATPVMTADCTHFRRRPASIIIACGDGGFFVKRVRYSVWTQTEADGRGIAVSRDCGPEHMCGGQNVTWREDPSRIRLDRVRQVFGHRVFTLITVTSLRTGDVDRELVLPLGCRLTPPRCPDENPSQH